MYRYDPCDRAVLTERVAQFRDQVARWQAGEISEDEFRPLRTQNGLYIQRHAPMLRIAVPYGMLAAVQLRTLARVARQYDRGYGHFTTRHNLQLNWPKITDVPDILAELAKVEMHSIQTSGNCVRNVTTDHYAGVAADEIIDPRPLCEILRQWSTLHPEFAYLPRKFKIAVNGAHEDRALTWFHDIGLSVVRTDNGLLGFRVIVGGGLGRTPLKGQIVREFLPWEDILSYCEAILRVYNRYGRRDNAFKSRIKILVQALGVAEFARQVEEEWAHLRGGPATLTQEEYDRIAAYFTPPPYKELTSAASLLARQQAESVSFSRWVARNVSGHRVTGYRAVTLSLKKPGAIPGNISAEQMEAAADLAERYSFGEVRVSHEQNLVLADVEEEQLYQLWQDAKAAGFATPNIGLLTDMICCPGGDLCDLANARTTPVARAVQERFDSLDYLWEIGEIELNFSGCMNSCGHHHVGHIGILGVDKGDEEWYQITIGGSQGNAARVGAVIGRAFPAEDIPDVIETLIRFYLSKRYEDERFIDTFDRLGIDAFKRAVYGDKARLNNTARALA